MCVSKIGQKSFTYYLNSNGKLPLTIQQGVFKKVSTSKHMLLIAEKACKIGNFECVDVKVPVSILHLFLQFRDMFTVVLKRVTDCVLEMVDRDEVREEGQNVFDFHQVVTFLSKIRSKNSFKKYIGISLTVLPIPRWTYEYPVLVRIPRPQYTFLI